MKLVTLNAWGGRLLAPFLAWVKEQSVDTDIFCFQEIFSCPKGSKGADKFRENLYQELIVALPGFAPYFAPAQVGFGRGGVVDSDLTYGLAGFVRAGLEVKSMENPFVFGYENMRQIGQDASHQPRSVQILTLAKDSRDFFVFNFHGLWTGGDKTDTPNRLEQSRLLKAEMDKRPGPKILCGDFNLEPQAESFKLLTAGMRDLIKDYGITDTRGSHYTKPVRFADYTLVSPEIKVLDFSVPKVEVSDHLPMILHFAV